MLPGNVQATADGHAWEHGLPANGSCPNTPRNLSNSISPSSIPSGAMQQEDLFWLTFPAPFQDQQPYTFPAIPWVLQEGGQPSARFSRGG